MIQVSPGGFMPHREQRRLFLARCVACLVDGGSGNGAPRATGCCLFEQLPFVEGHSRKPCSVLCRLFLSCLSANPEQQAESCICICIWKLLQKILVSRSLWLQHRPDLSRLLWLHVSQYVSQHVSQRLLRFRTDSV